MSAVRLARRDVKGGLGGLGLLFFCLALSVAGLASVLSLVSAMQVSIDDSGRAILGGDVQFEQSQRPPTAQELESLRDYGDISVSTATRAMVLTDGEVALVDLRGVDEAYPLAGPIDVEGRTPQNAGELALGREAVRRLGVSVGETLSLGGQPFRLSGILDRIPGGTFFFAPPALVTAEGLERSGLVVPGSLADYQVTVRLYDERADLDATSEAMTADLADVGWDADTREGAAGGTQRFVSGTGDMLLFVAIAALGIGALGIGSAMRAFAASRRATIARLKLVGAQVRTLAAMMAIETLGVTLLALVPGLALGAAAPGLVGAAVGDQLPVLPDPGPQWFALALSGAIGMAVTLAVAWRPLAQALRTPPKAMLRADALTGEGVKKWRDWIVPLLAATSAIALLLLAAGNARLVAIAVAAIGMLAGLFWLLGWLVQRLAALARRRGGPTLRLGIAALSRPGNATRRLTVALGLGLSILVALAGAGQSLLAELDGAIPQRAPSHFIIDIPRDRQADLERIVGVHAPTGSQLRVVPSLRGSITRVDGVAVADLPEDQRSWLVSGDRGLTFASELPTGNRLTAGEWWPTDYDGPALISLEEEAAADLGLDVGDTLTLSIAGNEVSATIASLRAVDWQSFGFNFGIVFAPGTLEAAPYSLMATISPVDPGVDPDFERNLAMEMPGVTAINVSNVIAEVRGVLTALDAAIRIATLLAIVIGVVVLAGSVVATRAARARDLVLLRLVGARGRQLVASQLVEFVILSVSAVALALGVGTALAWAAITYQFEIAFRPGLAQILGMAVAAVLVAVGAAMVAVWPALSQSPARALRSR